MKSNNIKTTLSTHAIVKSLKREGQDFDFYPTTDEIVHCIKRDIRKEKNISENSKITCSILDCGAGDGRVLNSLTDGKRYAIEKSNELLNLIDHNTFIVGTDFHQQTLLDKKVGVLFSNPPYSDFVSWTIKIIKETNAPLAYLVIPERWQSNQCIEDALAAREADYKIIGEYNFLNAERKARAKVHVIRINFNHSGHRSRFHRGDKLVVDPFSLWFKENFKINASSTATNTAFEKQGVRDKLKNKINDSNSLIKNEGIVKVLERFYHRDLNKLMDNYLKLSELDSELLSELNVSVCGAKEALQLKITSLKDVYWKELFDRLNTITNKLTSSSRQRLLDTLFEHTHVDFTAQNAHAIVIWIIKNANKYFESQLINLVDDLTEKSNVILYKSNKKTFGDEQWRYCRTPKELSHYLLDYRIVVGGVGGLGAAWYDRNDATGLSRRAHTFFSDICTVAANIGFDTSNQQKSDDFYWDTHVKNKFLYMDHNTGKSEVLFEAKAFKNGNIHIKFNQAFICKLNVEHGRLKGWIKSASAAASELDIALDTAKSFFNANLQLGFNDIPLLRAS